jgi:hypothetical protein
MIFFLKKTFLNFFFNPGILVNIVLKVEVVTFGIRALVWVQEMKRRIYEHWLVSGWCE